MAGDTLREEMSLGGLPGDEQQTADEEPQAQGVASPAGMSSQRQRLKQVTREMFRWSWSHLVTRLI